MDLKNDPVIPKCTSCNQKFSITKISPIKGRIPLILPCTHSICESCCKDAVKKSHKVECGICRDVYNLSPTDITTLKTDEQAVRSIFSINYHMMGVLAWQYGNQSLQPPFASFNPTFKQKETKPISQIIIPSTETCSHCKGGADFKCEQCDDFLCAHCFNIIHGTYAPLQKHKKVPIGSFNLIKSLTVCATHNDKSLEFYCEDCSKYICFNCMFTQTHCSTHKVKALAEWNLAVFEEIAAQRAVADETFRRLNKSLTDIVDLQKPKATGKVTIHKHSNDTIKVVNHYLRCHAALQVQEKEILKTLNNASDIVNNELAELKQTVIKNLIEVDELLNVADYAMTEENRAKVNLKGLSEKLAVVKNIPWFIYKDTGEPVSESKPSITIDDTNFDEGLKKHITLSDGNTSKYKILSSNEIPEGIEVQPAPETVIVSEYTIAKEIKNQQNIAKAVQELSAMSITDNISSTNSVLSSEPSSMKEFGPVPQQNRLKKKQYQTNQAFASPIPAGAPLMTQKNPNQDYTNKNKRNNRGGTNSQHMKKSGFNQQYSLPNNYQVPPPGYLMPNYQSEMPRQKMKNFTPNPQKQRAVSNLEPKPLELGSVEIVAVSSILNPHNFYIQRSASVQKLAEMSASFKISVPVLPPPSADKIHDTLIIVSHQNAFYRGKVLNIEEDKYRIFQVDYGNIINTTFDQLRSLPELYHETPWLATKCKLIKCDPIAEGKWSPENTDFMKKLIDSKPVVMHIVAIRKIQNQPLETVLDVNVALQEDSKEFAVDVADALISNRQAVHSNRNINMNKNPQYAQMMYGGNFARPNFFPANIPVMKSLITVQVTHIENPGKFYVRKIDNEMEFLDLTRALSAEYELAGDSGIVYLPEVGMCVACNMAMYTGDELDYNGPISGDFGTWFRARIIAIRSGLMVRVFLVDTGHIVNVSCLAIRKLTSSFLRMNMLAAECELFEVLPRNNKWSEESLEFMREVTKKPMKIWPTENRKNQRYNHVILYDLRDETKPSVNAQLVEAGYAIATGSTIIDTNMATSSAASVTIKTVDRPKEEVLRDIFEDGVSRMEVKVLDVESPSRIYLSFAEDYAKVRVLTQEMKDFYETSEPFSKLEWAENDRCAVDDPDKGWCRGRIVKVDSDAEVFLADHAVSVKVPLDSLRVLGDDFLAAKEALLCHLSGVAKASDGDWPMLTCEFLQDTVAACDKIFISKGGEALGKSFPVEMWTMESKAVEALEPAIKEWIKLNKKLVDQGLALPTDNKKRSLFDTLGSGPQVIDEWLQIHSIENKAGDGTAGSTVRMFTEWPKPLPLPIDESFDAIATYVDTNLDVYLHNVDAEHTLDFIKTELNRRFKDSKPSPKDKYWSVDQPCVAEFVLDKSYYRAKILEVNDDVVKVQFVDYGNEEKCDISKVRKAAVLCDIPIQCSRCRLLENQPKPGDFEQMHMDMLHKTLVDNRVTVTVLNALESDLYSVKLIMNDEIFNITEMIKYLNIFAAKTVDRMPVVKTEAKPPEQDDSEPDLIYDMSEDEGQEVDVSDESEDLSWVELANQARKRELARLCKYEKNSFADGASVRCIVEDVVNGTTFCLRVLSDGYEAVMADMQREAATQPRVLEVFEYKPCVALYEEDGKWYRAVMLNYDNIQKAARVLFIDYGNIEPVYMKNVRDSHPRWCEIPRCAILARINNTTVSHSTSEREVANILKESLLYKEVNGKIIALSDDASEPVESYIVELYDTDTGEPAYQSLYDRKLLMCRSENDSE